MECIDMLDAFHPQTILAYGMNGKNLPIPHGAPVRLRVEKQVGRGGKWNSRFKLDAFMH